jgi:putative ubiquitin-RnfH superfamily antitoxin RatB of RatAB toxin-antitoxin module
MLSSIAQKRFTRNMNDSINIEVVYALPNEQILLRKSVPAGTTVADAIQASGVLAKHPEIDLAKNKLGIFGKLTKADAVVRDKDRIEIYRPLIADPKEVRRKRAEEGKAMKKGGGDI